MKKRFLGLVLACVMLLTMLPTMAFAATTTFKVTSDKTKVNPGDEVTFTVALSAVDKLSALSFKLDIPTGLAFVSAAVANNLQSKLGMNGMLWNVDNKSFNAYGNMDGYTSSTDTTIMTFVCRVDNISNLPATLKVSLKETEMQDSDFDTTNPTASPATITVAAKTVAVTSVAVSSKTLNLEVGQTRTLTATVTPDNATDKTVTWTSSDKNVATVDKDNGTVTAVGEGTATITATAANGKKDTCKVTVKVPVCNHSEDKLTHVDGKAATCTENGVKEHYLCKCGTKLDLDKKTVLATTVIPATGHTVVKVDKVDPTCNTTGMKAHYECSVCGKWFSDKKGTKEIADAEKASYVIAADPDMHVYDIVKDSYKEYDEGYYVEQFQCTKCGDSYWLASVDLRDVDVKLVQDGKGDLKNAKVEVTSTSVKTKEVMSFYYNDTANAGDTLRLPVFFNYSKSATEAEAIAALKKDIAENSTFTVKAAATKSGWKFTTDKTYTVTVELDDAGKIVTKWVGSDNTEVSAKDTPTFTITGKKNTGGGGNGGSGNGGSTTTDTTKTDGKKVESGKTFDAGIAMYVGLSVLSVTGGALVIGKKKERF
jgi:uncharacterized repeat protein (TIGR01451 family)